MNEDFRTKKFCYVIIPEQKTEKGYIPSAVFEGVKGHHPMTGQGECSVPWYWGKDLEVAQQICDEQNERMGISKDEAQKIISQSMFGGGE